MCVIFRLHHARDGPGQCRGAGYAGEESLFVANGACRACAESGGLPIFVLDAGDGETAEGERKRTINGALDGLLAFLRTVAPFPALVSALGACARTTSKPVVRKQTFDFVFDWLRHVVEQNADGPAARSARRLVNTSELNGIMLMGLTDVWSVIRKLCAKKLHVLANLLALSQLDALFRALVDVAGCKDESWQRREGALLGITNIVRRFKWESVDKSTGSVVEDADRELVDDEGASDERPTSSGSRSGQTLGPPSGFELFDSSPIFALRIGQRLVSRLPRFVRDGLRDVLFELLTHEQLSIRENATKGLAAFLSRSAFEETLSAFSEAVHRIDKTPMLDDYSAEGLLGLCVPLIKQVPSSYLLSHWATYFPAFNMYLAHPASTVRQMTSTIFRCFAVKDGASAIWVKVVLYSLASGWKVDLDSLQSLASDGTDGPSEPAEPWEWKEGRLLAYELILNMMLSNHSHHMALSHTALVRTLASAEDSQVDVLSPPPPSSGGSSGRFGAGLGGSSAAVTISPRPSTPPTPPTPPGSASWSSVAFSPNPSRRPQLAHASPGHSPVHARSFGAPGGNSPKPQPSVFAALITKYKTPGMSILDQFRSWPASSSGTNGSAGAGAGGSSSSGRTSPASGRPPKFALRSGSSSGGGAGNGSPLSSSARVHGVRDIGQWLHWLEHEPVADVFKHLVEQTIQCHCESRWELRRIAEQVMRPLTHVLIWLDMRQLVSVWDRFLFTRAEQDLVRPSRAAMVMLRVAMRRSIALRHLIATGSVGGDGSAPPSPPQARDAHGAATANANVVSRVVHIVDGVRSSVQASLPAIRREAAVPLDGSKAHSLLGFELLVMIHARFDLDMSDERRRDDVQLILAQLQALAKRTREHGGDVRASGEHGVVTVVAPYLADLMLVCEIRSLLDWVPLLLPYTAVLVDVDGQSIVFEALARVMTLPLAWICKEDRMATVASVIDRPPSRSSSGRASPALRHSGSTTRLSDGGGIVVETASSPGVRGGHGTLSALDVDRRTPQADREAARVHLRDTKAAWTTSLDTDEFESARTAIFEAAGARSGRAPSPATVRRRSADLYDRSSAGIAGDYSRQLGFARCIGFRYAAPQNSGPTARMPPSGALVSAVDQMVRTLLRQVDRAVETVIVRRMLDIFFHASLLVGDLRYLKPIVAAFASRLGSIDPGPLAVHKRNSDILPILSNDIAHAGDDVAYMSADEEGEPAAGAGGSFAMDEEEDDWDDWDEEDETTNEEALLVEFGRFLWWTKVAFDAERVATGADDESAGAGGEETDDMRRMALGVLPFADCRAYSDATGALPPAHRDVAKRALAIYSGSVSA